MSELVTNAVRHAYLPGRVGWLRLAVLDGGDLLVDVSDPVQGFSRGNGIDVPPEQDWEDGRGLHLVRYVGELSWFLRSAPEYGKTVRVRLRPSLCP